MAYSDDATDLIRYQFKIVLLGDGGVGKTCLTNRFCYSEFVDTKMTIGLSFNSFSVEAKENGKHFRIGLSIWDFGGQQRFRPLLPQFISGCNGAIWTYDITSFHTLENLKEEWRPLLLENSNKVPTVLVGTKYDLINEAGTAIDSEIVKEYQAQLGASAAYMTSAKTGYNTSIIFKDLLREILKAPPYGKKKIQVL